MNSGITRPITPSGTDWDSDVPVDVEMEAWLDDVIIQGKQSLEKELADLGPHPPPDARRKITLAHLASVGEIRDLARKQFNSLREEERLLQMLVQGEEVPENIRVALQQEQQRIWNSLVSGRTKTSQPNRSRTVSLSILFCDYCLTRLTFSIARTLQACDARNPSSNTPSLICGPKNIYNFVFDRYTHTPSFVTIFFTLVHPSAPNISCHFVSFCFYRSPKIKQRATSRIDARESAPGERLFKRSRAQRT
jgi:hypothetical protein